MDNKLFTKLAHLIAWGRVGIGLAALVAPSKALRPWVGTEGDSAAARLLGRTMGGRDLALGIGALRALAVSNTEARPWVALGGAADAVDAFATVVAFRHLPPRTRWGLLAVTLGAAIASTRAAIALDSSAP